MWWSCSWWIDLKGFSKCSVVEPFYIYIWWFYYVQRLGTYLLYPLQENSSTFILKAHRKCVCNANFSPNELTMAQSFCSKYHKYLCSRLVWWESSKPWIWIIKLLSLILSFSSSQRWNIMKENQNMDCISG